MATKLTTQEFIDRARTVHGDRYGYAFVNYLKSKTPVIIHCVEHGMFEQTPSGHLSGKGCLDCSGKKKGTGESFVQKAREVHGENKYDYSKVEYVNAKTKIIIICHEHGYFEQTPSAHLSGQGCISCAIENNAKLKRFTNESFIAKAREVHGDKYGYSLVKYKNAQIKIIITCPEHGDFDQTPNNHLTGSECPSCAGVKKHTNDSFIEKAISVHGDKYDYSLVDYINIMAKVSIHCPEHGSFSMTPANHLYGQGCPGCAKTGFDRTKDGFLYVLRSDCGQYMKIGITNKPDQRQAQLSRVTPFSFKRIEIIEGPGEQIADLEKELLAEYQPAEFTETFDGYTEWCLWNDSIRHKLISFMDKELTNGPV